MTALAGLYGYEARACGRRGLTLFRTDHATAALPLDAQQKAGRPKRPCVLLSCKQSAVLLQVCHYASGVRACDDSFQTQQYKHCLLTDDLKVQRVGVLRY